MNPLNVSPAASFAGKTRVAVIEKDACDLVEAFEVQNTVADTELPRAAATLRFIDDLQANSPLGSSVATEFGRLSLVKTKPNQTEEQAQK